MFLETCLLMPQKVNYFKKLLSTLNQHFILVQRRLQRDWLLLVSQGTPLSRWWQPWRVEDVSTFTLSLLGKNYVYWILPSCFRQYFLNSKNFYWFLDMSMFVAACFQRFSLDYLRLFALRYNFCFCPNIFYRFYFCLASCQGSPLISVTPSLCYVCVRVASGVRRLLQGDQPWGDEWADRQRVWQGYIRSWQEDESACWIPI